MSSIADNTNGGKKIIYMTTQDVLELDWKFNPKPLRNRGGGIYRIVDRKTGELLYIGQASNLSNRLAPSVHHVFDRSKHDVHILFEQDYHERCKMEYDFIRIMKPKLNQRNGWMPGYTEKELHEQYKGIFE